MKNQNINIQILKNNNISPSHIRIKIYEYLSSDKIHPTVDEIYKDLVYTIPTLSKTTIYNTLKLFIEKELINAINLNDNTMRYELIRSDHGHLKCAVCSSIYDIPVDLKLHLPKELRSSIINTREIILTGICSKCLKDK